MDSEINYQNHYLNQSTAIKLVRMVSFFKINQIKINKSFKKIYIFPEIFSGVY